MAVELDAVSKKLVADYGWTNLGDGTVTNPEKTVIQSFAKNVNAPSGYDVSSKPYTSTETKETVVESQPVEKEVVAADTTNTVSGQTEQAFQGTAGSSGSAAASETPIDTGIVENQNPVNVGSIDNLEGVTVPDYASSQGATHFNSATQQYGTVTLGGTKTVGTNTYIDQVVKDADGNTVFEDKVVDGEPEEVITIKAGAEPKPELFTFDVNDIQDRGDRRNNRSDLPSYIDITDGKGGTIRIGTKGEIAATDDLVTAGLLDHEYFKREGITSIDQLTGSRGTGGEVTSVFNSATKHIEKLNVEQQKKIDAWKKENEIKTLQPTTKIEKIPKTEEVEQTETVNKFIFNPFEKPKEEEVVKPKEVDTGGSGASDTTPEIVYQTNPETQDTSTQPKVFTMDPNTLGIPSEAIMPTFNPSRVGTGVSTMPAETFTDQVQNQVTDLQSREADQATFYQPQTIAEKTEAGEDTSAFAITQKLFRNSATGQQIYIPFYGDQPQYPIPAGYVEVKQNVSTSTTGFNPITAGGNTFTANNQGGMTQGFSGEDGSVVTEDTPSPSLMEQLYGTVSFQNPMNPAQTVTQTPAEYTQSLLNKQAQATFNPASSVAMPGVAQMYEQRIDPTTGKAIDAMPGTVIESTAGQSMATAPIIKSDQLSQVSDVYQSRGPGSAEIKDASGAIVADAIPIPGAAQMNLTQAAPAVSKVLQGGTTVNYQGMADAIDGANWDVTTGTFNMNDVQFTPDQFVAANNLNLGDYMTTTGGLQPATQTALSDSVTGKQQQRQKIDPSTGKGMVDAAGNPVMETYTSIEDAVAAQGRATEVGVRQKADPVTGELMVDANGNPVMERVLPKRTLDQTAGASELITGTGVDQDEVEAAFGTGEVGAASIQGELTTLMAQFEGGETPAWAAGAMRNATAIMNERGLGASSMAGQAIIQAAMEAALPIAQIDTANKQQVALFKAEQRAKFLGIEFDQAFQAKVQNAARVSEIANINFNAEQQIALENSRAANTMNLNNLNNEQALVMAEAAALSQLDMAGLSNLQQAEVQNAQNFLAIDMASMNNKQSTALFKAQQTTNSMMTDVAAANAAAQFNATSENQTTQFMSNLTSQISQFNAAQQNAINQFNAKEANAVVEFNSALQNQREMFNAQNYLVVAQANAQWRQSINTANTASQNIANLTYAKEVNGLTQKGLDDYWQKERDIMSYIFAQSENSAERAIKILLGEQDLTGIREQLDQKDNASKAAWWSRAFFGDKGLTDLLKLKI